MENVMNSTINYNSNLVQAAGGQVVRRKNIRSVITALIILVFGMGLIAFSGMVSDHASGSYIALIVFGAIGILTGGFMLLAGSKSHIYLPTLSKIHTISYYFEANRFPLVAEALQQGDFNVLKNLKKLDNSGIRLDLHCSADHQFTAAQVFMYVPYNYVPASPIHCQQEEKARELVEAFNLK